MNRKLLSLILALVMVVGVFVPAISAEESKGNKVTIEYEVEVTPENGKGIVNTDDLDNLKTTVLSSESYSAALGKVVKLIDEKVEFDDMHELDKNLITFYLDGTELDKENWKDFTDNTDTEKKLSATFMAAAKPKFSIIYSNRITNKTENLKDFYMSIGSTRAQVIERLMREIKDIKFEDGFVFESMALSDLDEDFVAKANAEYKVFVYAKAANSDTDPSNPSKPGDTPRPGESKDLEKAVAVLKAALKVELTDTNKVSIKLPEIPAGLALDLVVADAKTNSILSSATIEGHKEILVPALGQKSEYKISLTVKDKATNKVSTTQTETKTVTVSDTAPVLNYAYVINGRVVLNITSPVGLSEKEPILYRIKGETDFTLIDRYFGYGMDYSYDDKWDWNDSWADNLFDNKMIYDPYKRLDKDDYAIDVPVPSVLQVIVTDKLGNRTPIQLDIKSDNVALTKTEPKYLKELIKAAYDEKIQKFKGNTVVVDKNTTVNLFDLYQSEILKSLKRFNIRDIEFYINSEAVEKWNSVKMDEFGRFKVTAYNTKNSEEFEYTILVVGKDENVKSYKLIKEAKAFSKDKFKGLDAIELTAVSSKKDTEANSFFIKYDDEFYPADYELSFGNNDEVEVEVFRKGQSKGKTVTIKRGELQSEVVDANVTIKPNPNVVPPTDVPPTSWAYNYIMNGIRAGLINGYTDGTFKPNNMISVKETLALVGRVALANPDKANAPSATPLNTTSSWGEAEINAALARLESSMLDISNLDRAVTRGEVAYIMNGVLNLNGFNQAPVFSDVMGTKYQMHIDELARAGIINGYTDGTFKPELQISREELAKMIVVAYNR